MTSRHVVLVNANQMRPPVAPLALDYIGDTLIEADYDVELIDLSFATEHQLTESLTGAGPIVVGVSFRNTDDCFWPSATSFVPQLCDLVTRIRSATTAPIVLGGSGYSVFPAELLEICEADLGIAGDGEEPFLRLIKCIELNKDYRRLPGLVYRNAAGRAVVNPPAYTQLLDLPIERSLINNARYLREGGMGNIETKRGCPAKCIYCADPLIKGRSIRCRPASQVADEIEALLEQGVNVLHLCDGEFNIPPGHALAVCQEIIARRLGEQVQWYCYASVDGFSAELAQACQQAGCAGINFGVDSACDRILTALGRIYRRDTIRQTVRDCKDVGIAVMLDLLIGAPGEDKTSVAESIAFIKEIDPDRAGAATGLRIYPNTPLARRVKSQGSLAENPNLHGRVQGNERFLHPVFYIDCQLGDDPVGLVCDLIAGDQRFFPPPRVQDATNYNYNDNQVLQKAIAAGARGAFWDILRRLSPAQS